MATADFCGMLICGLPLSSLMDRLPIRKALKTRIVVSG